MSTIKNNGINKGIIVGLSILILVIIGFYFLLEKSNEPVNNDGLIILESSTGTLNSGSGTGLMQPITLDPYIQDIDDTDIEKALSLSLKRYNDNDKKDLGDYEQLMYIYLDKSDYNQVIDLGLKALNLIKENGVTEEGIINTINSQLVQGYLYNGDLEKAKKIIIGNKFLEKSLERYMYEYKLGKYDFIINSSEDIDNLIYNERGYGLILLARSYSNIGNKKMEFDTYKRLYSLGKSLEGKDSLFETYYSYISTLLLLEKSKDKLSKKESIDFLTENGKYKNLIDSNSKIEYTESKTPIYYNKDLMYFNIERIINF